VAHLGTEHNTPELLEAAVLKTKRELGAPKMLVVDYLQLMTTSGKPESREREVAEVSRKLKKLALRYGLANIILAQLNRDSAKGDGKPGSKQTPRAPAPHDLRDSGAIEQDADVIFLLNIPHVYGQPDKQKREIIVGANRHGEADQTFTVRYEGSRTRYVDT
jgi:replicative DNA helicase